MKTKHTPAPWIWQYDGTDKSGLKVIAGDDLNIVDFVGGENIQEAEANARLIAAAPELLEALEQCLTRINPKSKDTWDLKAIHVAKAAIAKATGEKEGV